MTNTDPLPDPVLASNADIMGLLGPLSAPAPRRTSRNRINGDIARAAISRLLRCCELASQDDVAARLLDHSHSAFRGPRRYGENGVSASSELRVRAQRQEKASVLRSAPCTRTANAELMPGKFAEKRTVQTERQSFEAAPPLPVADPAHTKRERLRREILAALELSPVIRTV